MMHSLSQYSIVSQVPGAEPFTIYAYTGSDLSKVFGITQATAMSEGSYGWIQECGDAFINVSGQTQAAFADFRPDSAKLYLNKEFLTSSQKPPAELPSATLDENHFIYKKQERLSKLPPLLIEDGPYCRLIKEARDVFVDGHFYACVAMCGISFERFQRDKAKPYGATRKHEMWRVIEILQENEVLKVETLALCKKMARLRNDYAHGNGTKPKEDTLKALSMMHSFIENETNLMRNYAIVDGILHRSDK
jgi:hypothetical protein